jgi:hypothetical protein
LKQVEKTVALHWRPPLPNPDSIVWIDTLYIQEEEGTEHRTLDFASDLNTRPPPVNPLPDRQTQSPQCPIARTSPVAPGPGMYSAPGRLQ